MFSVKSLSSSALKGRAIVQHSGTLPWKGTWKCSKEPGNLGCPHIKIAFEVLREELKRLLGSLDDDTEFDPTMFGGESMVGGEGLGTSRIKQGCFRTHFHSSYSKTGTFWSYLAPPYPPTNLRKFEE
jgi:hypothetical protein